ncbi:MAG: acyltransferase [Actinomycetes bacterium]
MQMRRDIQGIRALAVLLVIANHLYPGRISGGYIGVDIFFVLSGYLITGQLLEKGEKSIGLAIRDFYASRLRRILPSALLVILVTDYITFLKLGPIEGLRVNKDGFWSTLFLANNWFNSVKLDYFGDPQAISLLQHFWSLAVEEQFYIFWPLILLGSLLIFRKRYSLIKVLPVLILLASLSFAAIEVHRGVPTSYFATVTRVWELMAGALLAIATQTTKSFPASLFTKPASLIALVAISLLYTDHTGVPGLATIPIVISALVLIAPGDGSVLRRILENRVTYYLGGISYVLYLWHWPIIALWEKYQGRTLHGLQPIVVLAIALALSILTHHLIENPIRFSSYLVNRPNLSICGGVTLVLLTIGIIQWVKVAHGV